MAHTGCASPISHWALIVALGLQGLGALAGGYALVSDPSGAKLGIPVEWLHGSPFSNYMVPGVVLLVLLGIGPLVVTYGLWAGRSWSPAAALVVGIALLVWLGVEIAVIGYKAEPPLQLVYGILGVVIVALSGPRAMQGMRR